MNCEQAEDILSAYLDNILDAPQRIEVEAHLTGCSECNVTLSEYRRYDGLLRAAPRVAPPETVRARIFESEEYAKLLRQLDHEDDSDRDTPAASPGRRRRSASWPQRGLQIAAALTLALGTALLVTQGLLHSSPSSRRTQPITISGTGQQAPLAAGNRVVYLRAGILWSAPENGVGIAQRLNPTGTQVIGWSVSPDGQLVAYIDATSGHIHIVRSDGQSDQVAGSATVTAQVSGFWSSLAGQAARGGLVWSPNGEQIAYLAATSPTTTTLRLMNADGTNDRVVDGAAGFLLATPVWSADSLRVAYTRSARGAESIWAYSEDLLKAQQLAAQVDATDANAAATRMVWLPDTVHPTLTWAASDGQSVTGLFSQPLLNAGEPVRLTPAGVSETAVGFSARGNGTWIASSAGTTTLDMISATAPGSALSVSVGSPVSAIVWSPAGDVVAYVTTNGSLGLWTPGSAPVIVTRGVSGAPVWSADGKQLAIALPDGVLSVQVTDGESVHVARISDAGGSGALAWAPDARALAIATPSGVTVVNADGSHQRTVDAQPADSSALTWTVAK